MYLVRYAFLAAAKHYVREKGLAINAVSSKLHPPILGKAINRSIDRSYSSRYRIEYIAGRRGGVMKYASPICDRASARSSIEMYYRQMRRMECGEHELHS
ncbi:MAG: hypothetical protein OEY99_02790 [Aigarchaeota archaeon]|nr:hypothetical protein [Aigarchaeota archaeon]